MTAPLRFPGASAIVQKQREALWVTNEINNVENQIAILHLRGAYLQEQSVRLETFLTRQSEQIAQLECRALCGAVLNSLPRELRDIVYEYLLDNHSNLERKRPALITQKGLHSVVPKIGALLGQHFVQVAYVGERFLSELVSRFWEVATLRIVDPGRTPDGQPSIFRYLNPFGSEAFFGQCLQNVVFALTFADVESLKSSSILEGLQSLSAEAREGCKVALELDIEQSECLISNVAILEYIGPSLKTMKAAGLRLQVSRKGEAVMWERLVN